MSKNKKEVPMWVKTGHAKPVSRRDFLSAGLLPFAASLMVPNWVSLLLPDTANAQDASTCVNMNGTMIPLVTLNLSGGAAMSANYLPMNAANQPIATYSKMGLGNNQVPIEREFGNVPFAGNVNGVLLSKMLIGIRSAASAAALANTAFVAIPCDSQNDTGGNKFDISGAVTMAGLVGSQMPNLGRNNTRTGINQAAGIISPPAPLIVSSYTSLLSSVGYGASVGANLNQNQRESLTKLVSGLSSSQTRKLASLKGGEPVKHLLDCAGIKNVDVVKLGASVIDPRKNTAMATTWNINANTGAGSRDLIFGSMVYNSLLGQAGSANLELGGYDYHGSARAATDAKDQDAGVVMGRVLESAHVLQKPVFLYVISDGSVFSTDTEARDAMWQGDRGSNGVAFMMYYNPAGRPATTGFQIGSFTDNQAADTSFVTGGNPELAAAAVFANWCKANRRMDLFEKIAGRLLDTSQVSRVVKVA
jgi:hypothetical protein